MQIWLKFLSPQAQYGYKEDLEFTRYIRNTHKEFFLNSNYIDDKSHKEWYHNRSTGPSIFYIIMNENKRIGTISFDRQGNIGNVIISEKSTGIGTYVMRQVEFRLKNLGIKKATVVVKDGNDRAIDFYHKLGYKGVSITMERSLEDED